MSPPRAPGRPPRAPAGWLAAELARFNALRLFVAVLALAAAVVAPALVPGPEAPPPARPAAAADRPAAERARRLREEAVEHTLASLRGIRAADVAVSDDGASARVIVTLDPGQPLTVEACAAAVRLVCDALPSVLPRNVTIADGAGRVAWGGGGR